MCRYQTNKSKQHTKFHPDWLWILPSGPIHITFATQSLPLHKAALVVKYWQSNWAQLALSVVPWLASNNTRAQIIIPLFVPTEHQDAFVLSQLWLLTAGTCEFWLSSLLAFAVFMMSTHSANHTDIMSEGPCSHNILSYCLYPICYMQQKGKTQKGANSCYLYQIW